jgi:hypothetical protein
MANIAISVQELLEINPPLILGDPTYHDLTNQVSEITEKKTPGRWYAAIAVTSAIAVMLLGMLTYQVTHGVGVWGNNSPVF